MLLTRPPAHTATVVAILLGANLTAVALAPFFHRNIRVPAFPGTYGIFGSAPSNHTTLISSLVVAGAIAVPRRWLPAWWAAGSAGMAAMTAALLGLNSHVLSDVLAGALISASWGAAGPVFVRAAATRLPSSLGPFPLRRGRSTVLLLTVAAVVSYLVSRSHGGVQTANQLEHLVVPILCVSVASLAVFVAVTVALLLGERARGQACGQRASTRRG